MYIAMMGPIRTLRLVNAGILHTYIVEAAPGLADATSSRLEIKIMHTIKIHIQLGLYEVFKLNYMYNIIIITESLNLKL